MSWSFYAIGKPASILAKVQSEFAASKCIEPEETIRQSVLTILQTSLSVYPDIAAVDVKASGSQTPAYSNGQIIEDKFVNTLSLTIQSLYGFVE